MAAARRSAVAIRDVVILRRSVATRSVPTRSLEALLESAVVAIAGNAAIK